MAMTVGSHEVSRANPHSDDEARYVLRADLEVFEAPDGDVYLLGQDEDHVLDQPGTSERALLRMLSDHSLSRTEMVQVLAGRADDAQASEAVENLLAAGLLNVYQQPRSVPLKQEVAERYDRQLAYFALTHPGAEHAHQQRLAQTTVVIVGVGGVGSWAAAALACVGVGKLVLVDDDRVELSNLNRQVLFRPQDIGALKVAVAAAALRAFNPDLEIEAHAQRVRGPLDVARFLREASVVVAAADCPPYRIARWINEACVRAGVPHISAGQIPPYIRIGPLVIPGETACVQCDERATGSQFAFYDEVVRQREQFPTVAPTLGPASAAVGSMIGMEILHHLTETCPPATRGCAVSIDMRSWQTATRQVARDKECPVCGDL
jgi:molybdopterin-synthase adenylyltransferase